MGFLNLPRSLDMDKRKFTESLVGFWSLWEGRVVPRRGNVPAFALCPSLRTLVSNVTLHGHFSGLSFLAVQTQKTGTPGLSHCEFEIVIRIFPPLGFLECPSARVRHYFLERSLVSFIPHPLILISSPTPFLFILLFYSHGEKTRLLRRELLDPHAGVSGATTQNFPPCFPSVLTYMVVLHISISPFYMARLVAQGNQIFDIQRHRERSS